MIRKIDSTVDFENRRVEDIENPVIVVEVVHYPKSIRLNLLKWEKAGIQISFELEGYGWGVYDQYDTYEEANVAYNELREHINKGQVKVSILKDQKLKLAIDKDE